MGLQDRITATYSLTEKGDKQVCVAVTIQGSETDKTKHKQQTGSNSSQYHFQIKNVSKLRILIYLCEYRLEAYKTPTTIGKKKK